MAQRFGFEDLIPHDEMLGTATSPYTEEEIARTSYRPTVIIGLGGTGYQVVRKLKRRIEQHFGASRARIFQFIVFDTAPESPPPDELALGRSDFVHLEGFPAARMIEQLDKADPIYRWWMRPHVPDFTGNGAGAIRAVGRLVFFRWLRQIIVPRLREKILAAVNVATEQGLGARSIKVYIVCSLAGGTGSGMFIDMAYVARNEVMSKFFNNNCYVTGVLVMPSAYVPLSRAPVTEHRFKANGYAALRELDLFNASKDFRAHYGKGYTVGRLTSKLRPFDITYLLSLVNENGKALPGVISLTEMVAEEMMLEIASPLQGDVNNLLDNVHETELDIEGHPTAYSSFSVASLLYPLAGVASWCALKAEVPFIREALLTPIKTSRDVEAEVDEFIDQLHLREELADQVIAELSKDKAGNEAAVPQIDYAVFTNMPEDSLLSALQAEEESCNNRLKQVKDQIEARRGELQLELGPKTRARIEALVRDPERGPRYAEWFLSTTRARIRAYHTDQMLTEQRQYQSQRDSAQAEADAARVSVEHALGASRFRPWRNLSTHVNGYVGKINERIAAEYQEALRAQAMQLYAAVLDDLKLLSSYVNDLVDALNEEARAAQVEAEKARVRLKITQSRFSLVKSVVSEDNLLDIYRRHAPPQASVEDRRALLAGFWEFFARRAPRWELGRIETRPEEGEAAQPFYYLGERIGKQLVTVPLLDRMQHELFPGQSRRGMDAVWSREIADRYTQAAAFWNVAVVRHRDEIDFILQRQPDLVGYGEPVDGPWVQQLAECTGQETHAVQTKNEHEIVFLRTVHALPLFAVHEVDAELKPSYDLLQDDWRAGTSMFPVHVSREWETEVAKRDPMYRDQSHVDTPEEGEQAKARGAGGKKRPARPPKAKPAAGPSQPAPGKNGGSHPRAAKRGSVPSAEPADEPS